jgi:hypothetical protein
VRRRGRGNLGDDDINILITTSIVLGTKLTSRDGDNIVVVRVRKLDSISAFGAKVDEVAHEFAEGEAGP